MVNKPNGWDYTVSFSQKNSDLNKVDIPESKGSVQLCLQSQFFIPCGNSKMIVLTKMGVTAKDG